jgi:glycosyltransferase involved in cell wall biosynthesis
VIDQKPDGYPGGIEYHQLDLIDYFIRNGESVCVMFPERDALCLRHYRDYRVDEVRYKGGRLDDHRLRDYEIEEVFRRILDDSGADIVHFQSIRTLPLALIETAKEKKKKVLATLHEYYFWCINCIMLAPDFCWFEANEATCSKCLTMNDYKVSQDYVRERRQYIDYLFSLLDIVIVPSFYVRDVFLSLYGSLTADRCRVVEFGVDGKILRTDGAQKAEAGDKLSLAFLGNYLHYKGNRTFAELVRYYRNENRLKFSIIGNVFDPSTVPSGGNLFVAGGYTRENVVSKIDQVNPDIILLLSNWPETFSYTLSESIAAGVPVIATDGGALRERVSRESVGFLVPVEDPLPRTKEIIEDLRQSPEVIAYLRKKVVEARKRLRTTDDMAGEILAIYRSLLQSVS